MGHVSSDEDPVLTTLYDHLRSEQLGVVKVRKNILSRSDWQIYGPSSERIMVAGVL